MASLSVSTFVLQEGNEGCTVTPGAHPKPDGVEQAIEMGSLALSRAGSTSFTGKVPAQVTDGCGVSPGWTAM